MYTLYGTQGSGSAAIEAALTIAQAPFKTVRASTWEDDSAQAELRALNPLGQIPTLRLPDGGVLTESAAILIHLGLEHPAAGLLPAPASVRAQAIRGLVYIAANCYSAISIVDYPERWITNPDEDSCARVRDGAKARLHHHWELFADQFTGQLLQAPTPGALDLLAAVVSRWSGTRAHLRAQRPALFTAIETIDTHPAVRAIFSRHWPGH